MATPVVRKAVCLQGQSSMMHVMVTNTWWGCPWCIRFILGDATHY